MMKTWAQWDRRLLKNKGLKRSVNRSENPKYGSTPLPGLYPGLSLTDTRRIYTLLK